MAEALLREKAGDRFHVQSAGVFAYEGAPPAKEVVDVLAEKGIRLDHHARQVDEEQMRWADLILAMTEEQERMMQEKYPEAADKIHTLKAYTDRAWQQLKALYVEVETKRAASRQANLSKNKKQLLEEEIASLQQHIASLEKDESSFNIADPLGGATALYRQISDEIEQEIDGLIADSTD